jgi:hypothetical protein
VSVGAVNYRPVFSSERRPEEKEYSNFQTEKEDKDKSGNGPQREARYKDELVDCLSAARRTPTPKDSKT